MTAKELRAIRAKLVEDAKALIPADGQITSEIRTKFESMMADAKTQADMVSVLDAEERTAAETRGKELQLPNVGEHKAEAADETRTREAFRNYLRTGAETRDLTVSADGILIPTNVAQPVVAKKAPGFILDLVGKMTTTTGAPIKLPLWSDVANSFVLNSTAITTTDPSVTAGPTLSVDDYRFNPLLLDNSLIQDAAFDIEGRVVNDIALRYQRDMSKFVTLGNGSNIAGLTSISAGITSATTLVVKYADFVSLFASLDPAYAANAVWTMSTATLGAVLNIVDSNQRPLFLPYNDGGTSGFVGQILGFNVKVNQYQPNIAVGAAQVQFGDFEQGYMFRTLSTGIAVKRLAERYAELNKIGYVSFTRVGGAVTDAGTHPIVTMTGR